MARAGIIVIIVLSLALAATIAGSSMVISGYEERIQSSDKEAQIQQLSERVTKLEGESELWKSQYEQADSRADLLDSEYGDLQLKYNALLDENNSIKTSQQYYQDLAITEQQRRQQAESDLSVAIKPPYTVIQGREISWAFKDSKGNLYEWNMPVDTYRDWIEYPEPEEYISLQTESGQTISVRDHTKFVESNSFSKVIDDIYVNSNNDYDFLYELWYITSQLSTYSTDIGEEPRWSLETLTEGGGDCEDLAILIASMIKASSHTSDWKVQMVYMDSDNPSSAEDVDHVLLFVETDEFSTFVEATAEYDGLSSWTDTIWGWYFEV